MTRRPGNGNPEKIRCELIELLTDFRGKLKKGDLRKKVIALVPAVHILRDLGCSLIPKEDAASARERILYYFLKYPKKIITGDELLVVSGIQEWARRLRELRVQFGRPIINGVSAKEMADEEGFPIKGVDVDEMGPDDYMLLDTAVDRESAHRWHTANVIRRKNLSVRDKLLEFLRSNVEKRVTSEELRYVAGDKTEWARRVRELRTEYGWPIVTQNTGLKDLGVGVYMLEADRQSPKHDRQIPDPLRRAVLRRDDYKCQRCGWTHDMWNRSDPRHLELHHIKPHSKYGETTEENLKTLCTVCHDLIHKQEKLQ